MKIAITGATGLVGSELARALVLEGHELLLLSRDPSNAEKKLALKAKYIKWPPPAQSLEATDAVIHLLGESIAEKRWTAAQKKEIRDSRVESTRELVTQLKALKKPPRILLAASAVGYYGSRGNEVLTENSKPAADFLAEVCVEWEREAQAYESIGRTVRVRTGVVLSAKGGAFPKMMMPFNLGAGGKLGTGEQWFSWIHLSDLIAIYKHLLRANHISGPVNAVAPNPVTNKDMTDKVSKHLGRPALLPVPRFALRLAVGEMADAILASERVKPAVLESSGFHFRYPELSGALNELLPKQKR
ncbi:MAG: TIGR01777 family oxidoreductase [Bdellovibrionia bacterium]